MNVGVLSLWGNPGTTKSITVNNDGTLLVDYGMDLEEHGSAAVAVYLSVEAQPIRVGWGTAMHVVANAADILISGSAAVEKLLIANSTAASVSTTKVTLMY